MTRPFRLPPYGSTAPEPPQPDQPKPGRRSLLALAALAPVAASCSPSPAMAAPSVHAISPALAHYQVTMSKLDAVNANAENDWGAVEGWTDDDCEAVQAVADEPATGQANFLRKVILACDRAEHTEWEMMDCERDLLVAIRGEARDLLRMAGGMV